MELTKEHIEAIKSATRDIEYGKVTISIAGPGVDIIKEQRVRFRNENAKPTHGKPSA
jgi:hypothetical protein